MGSSLSDRQKVENQTNCPTGRSNSLRGERGWGDGIRDVVGSQRDCTMAEQASNLILKEIMNESWQKLLDQIELRRMTPK
jgi:hypothetical protein